MAVIVDLDLTATKQIGIHVGKLIETFVWQDHTSARSGWVGSVKDWWTPEGTRQMRHSNPHPHPPFFQPMTYSEQWEPNGPPDH